MVSLLLPLLLCFCLNAIKKHLPLPRTVHLSKWEGVNPPTIPIFQNSLSSFLFVFTANKFVAQMVSPTSTNGRGRKL